MATRAAANIGHHCTGAKINGKIVPLKSVLQNGDIVEILTHPNRHPSRDWLTLAHTSRARSKIRAWLNANERERSLSLGKELTERECRKYKVSLREAGADVAWTIPFLRALFSLDPGDAAVAAMIPGQRKGRTAEAVRDPLLALAVKRPVVLVVEDLHWTDPHSEDVLRLVLDGMAAAPLMVVPASRCSGGRVASARPPRGGLAMDM